MRTDLGTALRAAKSERSKQVGEQTSNEESNQASKEQSNKTSLQQSNKDSFVVEVAQTVPEPVELVGMNIKVPKSYRLHWLIAAKKEGSNLTAVIAQALTERYGLPDKD